MNTWYVDRTGSRKTWQKGMMALTFDQLVRFLERTMSMSHIYQPLLIRTLVDAGGTPTDRQLAYAFLAEDESQLCFYKKRIKEMPLRVFTRHGGVDRQGELVSLAVPPLTFEQNVRLKLLCERHLYEHAQRRLDTAARRVVGPTKLKSGAPSRGAPTLVVRAASSTMYCRPQLADAVLAGCGDLLLR